MSTTRKPLDRKAAAIRLTRVVNDGFRNFEAMTSKGPNARAWCDMMLRRAVIAGYVGNTDNGAGCLIDILDKDGSLIDTYFCDRKVFRYLRTHLRVRVEMWEWWTVDDALAAAAKECA